jgi:deoxyhypusine synthase
MTTETLIKVQDTDRINDTRKKELLSSPVEHIDITKFDARPIVDAMGHMSFTSRDLARATKIYNTMLEDNDCSIILVVAGSTSAGGCMDLYAELVRSNMIDAVVATGATIVDMDFFEALGHKHYQANEIPDDDTLRSLYIDRIYDTYIDEEKLQDCDHTIGLIADSLEPRPYSSRAFIREMGKWLSEGNAKKPGSLVQLAYENDVPIFCPAFTDSSAGFGLVKHQVDAMKRGGHYMTLDSIADFRELTDIKVKAGTTGLLMIGGGVPKNFTQDTVVCAEILGHEDVEVHKYAVQITVADVRDGACSSSTLQEAASWGKVSTAMEQMVFAEATSVLPLLASDAWHRLAQAREAPLREAVRLGAPAPSRLPRDVQRADQRDDHRAHHVIAGRGRVAGPADEQRLNELSRPAEERDRKRVDDPDRARPRPHRKRFGEMDRGRRRAEDVKDGQNRGRYE